MEREVAEGTKSPGTLDTYRSVFRRHVQPALDELPVREVDTPAVDRALSVIKRRSVSGARTAKIVISGTMRYAARHGAVVVNPVREVGRIDSPPRHAPRALTAEERQRWMDAVRDNEKARMWDLPDLSLMMLATGCRIGECLAIGWSEIDLEDRSVDVRWHLVRQTGVGLLRLASTKSGRKGERLVPLPSWAITMLKRRRLVASYLDDSSVSVRRISDQLGHSNIRMTQDRYLGRRLTDRQTADALEAMFVVEASETRRDPKGTRDLDATTEPGL